MLTCTKCGASGTGAFCGWCGSPLSEEVASPAVVKAPRVSAAKIVGFLLLGALALACGVVAVVLAMRGQDDRSGISAATSPGTPVQPTAGAADPSAGATLSTSAPAVSDTSTEPSMSSSTSAAPSSSSSSSTLSAQAQGLDDLRAARLASLEGLVLDGRWALRLSSKSNGIVDPRQRALDGSHVFHYDDIAAEHARTIADVLAPRGWPSLTLLASDYGSYHADGDRYWVLIADPGGIASPDAARARCAELYSDKTGAALENLCMPTRLAPS
ncbi:MAG: hypothetical protein IPH03_02810 [Tetrasphaera sp.]|nr:hypothetical protein [Tetrasphaera sp.]